MLMAFALICLHDNGEFFLFYPNSSEVKREVVDSSRIISLRSMVNGLSLIACTWQIL